MAKEYKVSYSELEIFSYDLILRYDNKLLGDTVYRVGRDTVRKLGENDRFVGAIRMCMKHGIVPTNIIRGMAAGFLFSPEGDKESYDLRAFLLSNGIYATLEKYCKISKNEPIADMIAEEYNRISR